MIKLAEFSIDHTQVWEHQENMQMRMELGMYQRMEQKMKMGMTLEQRLALELAMKLELTLKQALRLFPQLRLVPHLEQSLKQIVRQREDVLDFLETRPSAYELKREYPEFRPLFDRAYRETYQRSEKRQKPMLRLEMSLSQGMYLAQTQSISMPEINWSFVDAVEKGKQKTDFPKKEIPGFSDLSHIEKLKAIDEANEVFRFAYVEDDEGNCFRVPLLRNRNIETEEIKQKISKKDFRRWKSQIEGTSGLERIAKAIPYSELYFSVKEFIEEEKATLDDVVIVGVDRGGRVPARIMRYVLGKPIAYFLKVDQGGGGLDNQRLMDHAKRGTFKDKFVLFVDSTVDSGRQIEALKKYMNTPTLKEKLGYKGWGIVGSNEDGLDLPPYHKSIDWGLDPDQSFEDDPKLLGVDYADSTQTRVKAVPSQTSATIRSAIREIPTGVILDFSVRQRAEKTEVSKILKTKTWQKTISQEREVEENPFEDYDQTSRKIRVAISGSSNGTNRFSLSYLSEFGRALSSCVDVLYTGTELGGPGEVMRGIAPYIPEVVVVRPETETNRIGEIKSRAGVSNIQISFSGTNKDDHRKSFPKKGYIHIVLDGKEGTLAETVQSVQYGKPTLVLESSNVGQYFRRTSWRNRTNVYLVSDLPEMVRKVREFATTN